MKYGNATLNQFEKVIDKLGGMEILEDLLKGNLQIELTPTHALILLIRGFFGGSRHNIDPRITPSTFPEEPVRSQEYKLYHFQTLELTERIVERMRKDGYSPANLYEGLLWKDWNREDCIVLLGQTVNLNCRIYTPWFSTNTPSGVGKKLGLEDRISWFSYCRFLAVRNPALTPTSSP